MLLNINIASSLPGLQLIAVIRISYLWGIGFDSSLGHLSLGWVTFILLKAPLSQCGPAWQCRINRKPGSMVNTKILWLGLYFAGNLVTIWPMESQSKIAIKYNWRWQVSYKQLFTDRTLRLSLIIGLGLQGAQQLSGVNAVRLII